MAHFSFQENNLALKTYFTQEMLKRGFLASTACYTSFAHSEQIISEYLEAVESVFADISCLLSGGSPIENSILGPVCHSGFERLN